MREYYVYILHCSDGTYYTGVTNDYVRRFQEHESGIHPDSYTCKRRPLTLVYVRTFLYILDAISYEKQIKNWSRAKKKALIKNNEQELHLLAHCMNESHFSYYKTIQLHMRQNRASYSHMLFPRKVSGRA